MTCFFDQGVVEIGRESFVAKVRVASEQQHLEFVCLSSVELLNGGMVVQSGRKTNQLIQGGVAVSQGIGARYVAQGGTG